MRIHTYWYRRYFILLIIIFSNVLSSIANAEDMGRERAYCYRVHRVIILRLHPFPIILVL